MKKQIAVLIIVIVGITFALSLATMALAQGPTDSQPGAATRLPNPGYPTNLGDDSNPKGTPVVFIPEQYRPKAGTAATAATGPVAIVYFTPQDENTSTTVLFLYNTNAVTETVGMQTFYINGSLTISTSVNVPPNGLVRICADSVNTVSASWSQYVLINFTTFSAYAKMTVPAGVKADGYVAWDTVGFYDPLSSTVTLPLRFSTDPPTVFLPAIQR